MARQTFLSRNPDHPMVRWLRVNNLTYNDGHLPNDPNPLARILAVRQYIISNWLLTAPETAESPPHPDPLAYYDNADWITTVFWFATGCRSRLVSMTAGDATCPRLGISGLTFPQWHAYFDHILPATPFWLSLNHNIRAVRTLTDHLCAQFRDSLLHLTPIHLYSAFRQGFPPSAGAGTCSAAAPLFDLYAAFRTSEAALRGWLLDHPVKTHL